MSEVLNVIYSGSSCWEPLKGKELRGIQEECTGLILLPKQMLLFFSFLSLSFLIKEQITQPSLAHSAGTLMCVK